jgi:hypothetical protein
MRIALSDYRIVQEGDDAMAERNEVWQAAEVLVRQHGDRAPRVAALIAHELLEAEETEQRLVWMRVMAATRALLQSETAMC